MGEGPLGFEEEDDGEPRREDAPRRRPAQWREDPEAPASPPAAPTRSRPWRRGPTLSSQGPRVTRNGWIALLVGIVIVGYITVNTLSTDGPGSAGPAVGTLAPVFAAPAATGDVKGDVNVARDRGQGQAGAVPACSIHRSGVITACDVWRTRPAVLAFFGTRGASGCVRELDTVQRVAARHRDVAFVGISIRGDRGDVRKLIDARGWTFPVAYDEDGILANLYGVAVCPLVTYVRAGGRVAGTDLGAIGQARLEAQVRRLEQRRPLGS